MKRLRIRSVVLLAGALLLAAPAVTMLPGCGGSSQPQLQVFNNMAVDLGNGQTATLSLSVRGTSLTGTLVVPPPPPSLGRPGTEAITFTIPAGTYVITGTFTAPRGFTAAGTFPAPIGAFTVTGQIPTPTAAGSFSFTANGQTVTGVIPPLGTPTPTPTASGTPTPTQSGDRITGTISGQTGANVTDSTFDQPLKSSTVSNTPGSRIFTAIYEDRSGTLFRSISLEVQPSVNLAAGQSFSLATGSGSFSYFEALNSNPGGTAKNWDSISGTLRIDSVVGDIVRFTVQNARLQARTGDNSTGSFTISGTGQARTSFGGAG